MKTRILIAAVSLLLFGVSQPAGAVTLNNGDVAIYNFDFVGQTPNPPYVLVNFGAFFSGVTSSTVTFDFFTELNANGANIFKDGPGPLPTFAISIGLIDPGILDGIFSVKVTANGNPFDITQASAVGFLTLGFDPLVTPPVQGELVTPLPSAFPLFASGAGLLGYMGWRRKKKAIALAT